MKTSPEWTLASEPEEWDSFIEANQGTPYQWWDWRRVLEACGNDPEYLIYRGPGREILAVCPFYRVRLGRFREKLSGPPIVGRVSTLREVEPRTLRRLRPVPSFFTTKVNLPQAVRALQEYMKRFLMPPLVSMEVLSFQPRVIESLAGMGLSNWKATDYFLTDLNAMALPRIWAESFGKHDRQDIKYFEGLGASFRVSSSEEEFSRFLKLHEETMTRQGLHPIRSEFLSLMRQYFGDKLRIGLFVQSGELVAGQLLIIDADNHTLYIDRIGYTRAKNIRSSVVSLWFKVCGWAVENGFRYVNFGGGWTEEGYRLKRKFGGELLDNHIFIIPRPGPVYHAVTGLMRGARRAKGLVSIVRVTDHKP